VSGKKEHLDIINDNFETLCHLSSPNPSDHTNWSTTIIFYMALHYIHACLSIEDDHPTSHKVLERINFHPNLKPLYQKYRQLKDDSEDARYRGGKLSVYDMRRGVLMWFRDIQDEICSILNIPQGNKYHVYDLFPLN
jgi:hypothetical protein